MTDFYSLKAQVFYHLALFSLTYDNYSLHYYLITMFDNIQFNPMDFVDNLQYMGKGMLGIFVVTAVIVLFVNALNNLPEKKDKEEANKAQENKEDAAQGKKIRPRKGAAKKEVEAKAE